MKKLILPIICIINFILCIYFTFFIHATSLADPILGTYAFIIIITSVCIGLFVGTISAFTIILKIDQWIKIIRDKQ